MTEKNYVNLVKKYAKMTKLLSNFGQMTKMISAKRKSQFQCFGRHWSFMLLLRFLLESKTKVWAAVAWILLLGTVATGDSLSRRWSFLEMRGFLSVRFSEI